MMFFSYVHLLGNDKISFFFVAVAVVRHLGCSHSLAIVNSAAINMGVQVPLE
jgi:hypothetical protein